MPDVLYQLHNTGRIFRFTGEKCTGDSCPGWEMLDNNPATIVIAADAGKLYQLHNTGRIFRFTGEKCTGDSCPGWEMLDNNPATIAIAADAGKLYQLHNTGRIFRFTGEKCTGDSCPGWEMLDNNPATIAIAADAGNLYQLHNTGRIFRFTGEKCTGDSCPGWEMLDNNPATIAIAADAGNLYQLHNTGRIFRFTGEKCTGDSCPGWEMLDNNPATIAIAADGGNLYQLHNTGRIFRFTGEKCTGDSCPGWEMLDNNPATVAIRAGGGFLYQLHNTGRIFRFTGEKCTGDSCPGWEMLDNNPATVAISSPHLDRARALAVASEKITQRYNDVKGRSLLGLALDQVHFQNGEFIQNFRSGNIKIDPRLLLELPPTVTVTRKVQVFWTGLECRIRQEKEDEVLGTVASFTPSSGANKAHNFPDGQEFFTMGKVGSRIVNTNVLIGDCAIGDLLIVCSLVEHDSGDTTKYKEEVAKLLAKAATAFAAMAGADAETLAANEGFIGDISLGIINAAASLLGADDDQFNPGSILIHAADLLKRFKSDPLITPDPFPIQLLVRDDDAKKVEFTHSVILSGTDDGGDRGEYGFYFDVRLKNEIVVV